MSKREKHQRLGTYGAGIGLDGGDEIDDGYDSDLLTETQKQIECKACGRKGHKTKANKLCPMYKPRKKKARKEKPGSGAAAATTTITPQPEADDAADADRMDALAFNNAVGSDDEFFDTEEFAEGIGGEPGEEGITRGRI